MYGEISDSNLFIYFWKYFTYELNSKGFRRYRELLLVTAIQKFVWVKSKLFLNSSTFCADDVYAELVPILRSALDGHNVCIFAYG